MEHRRLYPDMTAEEQLQWVTDFEALMQDGGGRIVSEARRRQPQWQPEDAPTVRRLVGLLAAWPFAQDFAEKAQRYGDYMARATRLPVYVDKVMERLADGLTMTDKDGRTVAYVSPSAPLRRRGRPSREELAARQRGEQPQGAEPDDAEARKRRTVARMLGIDVIVSGSAPREKNNAELKADRDRRRAEYERQNPSLFGDADGTVAVPADAVRLAPAAKPFGYFTEGPDDKTKFCRGNSGSTGTGSMRAAEDGTMVPVPSESPVAAEAVSPCAQLMSDSYEMRMAQDKLHLDQLAWLLSKPLQERVRLVQSQRTASEAASERAKMLAEMGGSQTEIAEYAEQAKVSTEAYLQTYAAVDEELAVLHKRLYLDVPFVEGFKRRFKGVDVEKIQYITRPYYEKVKSPELDLRIKTVIEQENPEYAARMKAEQAKKEEVADILRYLKRKDKDATDVRLKTAKEVKFPRLVELIGEKEAADYLPLIAYIEEENRKWREAKGKGESSGTGTCVPSADAGTAQQEPVPAASAAASEPDSKERKKPGRPKKPAKK